VIAVPLYVMEAITNRDCRRQRQCHPWTLHPAPRFQWQLETVCVLLALSSGGKKSHRDRRHHRVADTTLATLHVRSNTLPYSSPSLRVVVHDADFEEETVYFKLTGRWIELLRSMMCSNVEGLRCLDVDTRYTTLAARRVNLKRPSTSSVDIRLGTTTVIPLQLQSEHCSGSHTHLPLASSWLFIIVRDVVVCQYFGPLSHTYLTGQPQVYVYSNSTPKSWHTACLMVIHHARLGPITMSSPWENLVREHVSPYTGHVIEA